MQTQAEFHSIYMRTQHVFTERGKKRHLDEKRKSFFKWKFIYITNKLSLGMGDGGESGDIFNTNKNEKKKKKEKWTSN